LNHPIHDKSKIRTFIFGTNRHIIKARAGIIPPPQTGGINPVFPPILPHLQYHLFLTSTPTIGIISNALPQNGRDELPVDGVLVATDTGEAIRVFVSAGMGVSCNSSLAVAVCSSVGVTGNEDALGITSGVEVGTIVGVAVKNKNTYPSSILSIPGNPELILLRISSTLGSSGLRS
jgi:hypothetical protein